MTRINIERMGQNTMVVPYTFIYFNRPEINSLYAQLVGWVPKTREKKNGQSLKGGLFARIPFLGGLINGSIESGKSESAELSDEKKLTEIEKILMNNGVGSASIADVLAKVPEKGSTYARLRGNFDAPQFRDSSDPIRDINDTCSLLLEYENGHRKVLISLGLEHMPRVYGARMSRSGHDAILFREFGGKAVPLELFGFIHQAGTKLQIRPISVSFVAWQYAIHDDRSKTE